MSESEKKPDLALDQPETHEEQRPLHPGFENLVNDCEAEKWRNESVLEKLVNRSFSFVIKGDSLYCGMCKMKMDSQNQKELTMHISNHHFDELDEPKSETEPPKDSRCYKRRAQEEPSELDNAICLFLAKFGLPADVVRDASFTSLVTILNKTRSLPTPPAVELFVRKNSEKLKKEISGREISEPLAITVDVVKQKSEVFLAYSAHYYDKNFTRMNSVFLRKLPSLDLNPTEILVDIRKAVFGRTQKVHFTSFVVTNSVFEKEFYKTGCINNSFICYYSYIQNFADSLIRADQFSGAIEVLRDFFHYVRASPGVYAKLQRYFTIHRVDFDLPETDLTKWTGIANFLSQTLHLHEYFLGFIKKNNINVYIGDADHANLSYLLMILGQLQTSVKKMSKPEALISQVVPEISEFKKFIYREFPRNVKSCFTNKFEDYLQPLLSHYRSGVYDFSTFLDPRFAFDTEVFMPEKRIQVRNSLKNELVRTAQDFDFGAKYETMIERELITYELRVKGLRPGTIVNPLHWWLNESKDMPTLFTKALISLGPPPCAIDAEHFFGKRGKMIHLNGRLSFKKYNEWLLLGGSQERFRGRGWPENEPMPLDPLTIELSRSVTANKLKTPIGYRSTKKQTLPADEDSIPELDREASISGVPFSIPTDDQSKPSCSDEVFVVKNEPIDEDDQFESMLMQPPPEKSEVRGFKSTRNLNNDVKMEEDENGVGEDLPMKNDIDNDDEYYATMQERPTCSSNYVKIPVSSDIPSITFVASNNSTSVRTYSMKPSSNSEAVPQCPSSSTNELVSMDQSLQSQLYLKPRSTKKTAAASNQTLIVRRPYNYTSHISPKRRKK